jgi:uncharacterized protein YkwD
MNATKRSHFGAHGAIALATVFGTGGLMQRCTPTPSVQAASAPTPLSSECTNLANRERAAVGLAALTENATLISAASQQSAFQAQTNTMTHSGRGGADLAKRLTDAGYAFSIGAENVAVGYTNCSDVIRGWMNSPHHKDNILNAQVTEIGVAASAAKNGTIYWTMDLGAPS